MKDLAQLLQAIECEYTESNRLDGLCVEELVYDSRRAHQGAMFVALVGFDLDGHRFAADAYARGARAFLLQQRLDLPADAVQICVADTRAALAELSAAFFDYPARELTLIGITGTKGKTTTAFMIYQALRRLNREAGLLGTLGAYCGDFHEPLANTTPESYEVHRLFRLMADRGAQVVVMECSSGGIMGHRLDGITFDYAVFTNLGHDHVGPKEHPDFDHYVACKQKLFAQAEVSLINLDDPAAEQFRAAAKGKVITFSLDRAADYRACARDGSDGPEGRQGTSLSGQLMRVRTGADEELFRIPLIGRFNLSNALAAIAVLDCLGFSPKQTRDALADVYVPGRMEVYEPLPSVTAVIDYAHNRESLARALSALREQMERTDRTAGRLICVFGSIGGRSQARRKEMAEVVAEYADLAMITSDEPYNEDPAAIIQEIRLHLEQALLRDGKTMDIRQEVDRVRAIRSIMDGAEPGDVILFAGLGRTEAIPCGGRMIPYSEYDTVMEAARLRLMREGTDTVQK